MLFGMIKYIPKKKLLLGLIDFTIVSLILYASFIFNDSFAERSIFNSIPTVLISLFIYLFSFYLFDLYNISNNFISFRYHFAIWSSILSSTILIRLFHFSFNIESFSLATFISISVLMMIVLSFIRVFFYKWFKSNWKVHNVLVVGTDSNAKLVYNSIKKIEHLRVIGFLDEDPKKIGIPVGSPCVVGTYSDIENVIDTYSVSKVVISSKNYDKSIFKRAISRNRSDVEFYNMPSFYESITGKIPIESIDESWFIEHPILGMSNKVYTRRVKRFFDIFLSTVQLVFFLPIFIILGIVIKLTSRGPVFYRQWRVGMNGNTFEVIKFRSMVLEAEKYGAIWASREDDRITGIGKIIRRFRLDELPQLWNVLKGEMSLIGPRPERPEFFDKLTNSIPFYSLRLSVKPGITGWAQVNNGYTSSIGESEDKLKFDLYYIKNLSPYLDLLIVFKTIKVIIWGRGAI